jgi:hypothetical protein
MAIPSAIHRGWTKNAQYGLIAAVYNGAQPGAVVTPANTAVTGIFAGTPVVPALALDSIVISPMVASGDILLAANAGGNSQAWLWVDSSAGTLNLFGAGTATVIISATVVEIEDNILLALGNDQDSVLVHRTATLAANTALTGVLIGTPVAQALAANSSMISNVTADGDIAIYGNLGGNSQQYVFIDVSAAQLFFDQADVHIMDAQGLIIGATAQIAVSATTTEFQVLGTTIDDSSIIVADFNAGATNAPFLFFAKSRGATIGSFTIIVTGDLLGRIDAWGADGVDFNSNNSPSASIRFAATGTIAADRVPGEIQFWTATDAAPSVATQRVTIGNDGAIAVANGTPKLTMGTVSTFGTTQPTNTIVLREGTAPAGAITTAVGLFSSATVMRKIIADSTVTNVET